MLTDVETASPRGPRTLDVHAPIFIGLVPENSLVKTGIISLLAYKTELYDDFVNIVTDLRTICDDSGSTSETILRRLPAKVRNFDARLQKR